MRTGNTVSGRVKPVVLAGSIIAGLGLTVLTVREGLAQSASSAPSSAVTRPASFNRAFVITIEDDISDITYDSLERRLTSIRDKNPGLIIIELDTPGGALGATLDICDAIKDLRDDGVKVYAWINNRAYSAGTIIALATDGIVMASKTATIGDCQPIQITPSGASAIPDEIEAKATSPLLAELRDSARRGGYNLDMVLALIRPEMEVFWLENTETGERRFVDVRGRDELFGLIDANGDESGKRRGGLLGLFGEEKAETQEREPGQILSDEKSQTAWRYVKSHPDLGEIEQPIVSHRELLTMKGHEAAAYGFSLAMLRSEDDLKTYFHITGVVERLENTWIESAIEWLASPMVRGVLFLLMLLGAYTEFQTPGFGLPGGVALVALVLFLGAPYLAGFTVTWEIVAIVLGIVLLAIEAFVIPGFGVAGITGIILLAVGLLASFVPEEPTAPAFENDWFRLPTLPATYRYLRHGLYSLAAGLTGSIFGMVLIAKYFPQVPIAGRIIAPNPDHDAIQMADPYDGTARVGDIGQAESLLRPAGKARFGATLVDVVSEGEYIEAGTRVEVVQRHGNRVVVRRVD